LTVGLFLIGATASSQAIDRGDFGGNTGFDYREQCNPGHVLIGLSLMTGKSLDRINPICIGLNPQRQWTGEAYEKNWAGGGGGSYQKVACEPGEAVVRMTVFMDRNGGVHMVKLLCGSLSNNYLHDVSQQYTGGENIANQEMICAPGEFGSGIYGKAEGIVIRVGLSCEQVAPASAAAVVTPPVVVTTPAVVTQPTLRSVKVVKDVDITEDEELQNKIGELHVGDAAVLVKDCEDDADRCNVFFNGVTGWSYRGKDYMALELGPRP